MSRVRVRVRVIEKETKSERHPGRPVSTTKAAGSPRECLGLGLGLGLLKKKTVRKKPGAPGHNMTEAAGRPRECLGLGLLKKKLSPNDTRGARSQRLRQRAVPGSV